MQFLGVKDIVDPEGPCDNGTPQWSGIIEESQRDNSVCLDSLWCDFGGFRLREPA
jgi:hypothetical protein